MSRIIFIDTLFWIALLSKKDEYHAKAKEMGHLLDECQIVTSQMVLTEVLDAFANRGEYLRLAAIETVESILDDENVEVIEQTSERFHEAFRLYRARRDKEWGLTDCASMKILEEKQITEVLTCDHHFTQAGHTALLREMEA